MPHFLEGVDVFYLLDFCGLKDFVIDLSHKVERYDNFTLVWIMVHYILINIL